MKEKVFELQEKFKQSDPLTVISWFAKAYQGKVVFSTSLGAEDQVIAQMIASLEKPVRTITLDTGRLFQETYNLLDITDKKYRLGIEVFFPENASVEAMVKKNGINLFYDSIDNRRLCCAIRKTAPMKRALEGMKVWITGLRQDQSVTRNDSTMIAWDDSMGLIKVNPLIYWTNEMVWYYLRQNNVPYNELHDNDFPSIGCLPCTRAVQPGEDPRAGRWWWESAKNKECGLHR
jgi:phosphoadenosine phosphosulfate reductase